MTIIRIHSLVIGNLIYTCENARTYLRIGCKILTCRAERCGALLSHEHCGRVVSKQELCEQVWEGLASSDATLESCRRAGRDTL